jgi:hypothetical protein
LKSKKIALVVIGAALLSVVEMLEAIIRRLRRERPPDPDPETLPSALALMSRRMLYKSRDDLIVDSLKARPRRRPRF